MAIVYGTTIKNARLQVVVDAIDAGAAGGRLNLYTAAYGALLAVLIFDDPCGTISGGVLTFAGMPKSFEAIADGVLAVGLLLDSDGTEIAGNLTVGTSGADIIVDKTDVATGQTINLNSASITHG